MTKLARESACTWIDVAKHKAKLPLRQKKRVPSVRWKPGDDYVEVYDERLLAYVADRTKKGGRAFVYLGAAGECLAFLHAHWDGKDLVWGEMPKREKRPRRSSNHTKT